jgi:hypothetical protein
MHRFGVVVVLGMIAATMPSSARAADPRFPDWPCAQAKVPELSVGTMWDGPPIADVGNSWQDDPKLKDLVVLAAARRTPLDAAQKAIVEFMSGIAATDKQSAAAKLFAGLFDTLNQERNEVMNGIERVSRNETELAGKIKSDVETLHQLEDKPDQDQAKVNDLASQVEWSTRIFEDRRKTIRYVCEVPGTIEQRLFALARVIQQNLN